MFDSNDSLSIDKVLEMIGGPINGINLTPFSIMSGTLIGVLKPTDTEAGALMILTSKEFTASEELQSSEVDIIEFVGEEIYNKALSFEKPENVLDLEDETCKIKLDLDKTVIEGCKIIMMPFTDMVSEESIINATT